MHPFIIRLIYRKVPARIDKEYHEILIAHSTYYKGLNEPLQRRFRTRLYQLLNVMRFSSAQIRPISREIRAVIGCAIIELTFGLNRLPAYTVCQYHCDETPIHVSGLWATFFRTCRCKRMAIFISLGKMFGMRLP